MRGASYGTQGRVGKATAAVSAMRQSARALNRASVSRRALIAQRDAGYVDLAFTGFTANTTGQIGLVATIAQGVSVNQRIGKKAKYKSVQLRGQFYANAAATINDTAVLLIYDRKPQNALPAITDVLVTATPQSFMNDANSDRFRVLRRWDNVLIGNSTTPATGKEAVNFDQYVPLNGLPVEFGAAGTGAIGDISTGALYLIVVGNVAAGTGAATCNIGCRTRFVDV